MSAAVAETAGSSCEAGPTAAPATRREKREERKKERRRRARREAAARARAEQEALAVDPEEERRLLELEVAQAAEESERARQAFEEAERRWLEAAAARAEEKAAAAAEEKARAAEASSQHKDGDGNKSEEDSEWDYVEDGPAEIIWQGNEIIVKKKKVKVPKGVKEKPPSQEDKAHCPFHLKTGACRFGVRCSRVHFYPDKSCTLLMKHMYNGPGLALEQDEGLEFTDDEIEQSYEEFYEDVHTEFLKFGELVNFKVCRNGSFHLRGNVYVHYKSLDSALLAYNSMNGRYFAGKQTCSHGAACNFIHCFRNPGGDYEWSDWDNPPPKYWIRKMTALFGLSADTKLSNSPDFEWSQGSDRKRLKSSRDRYVSRRPKDEDGHKRHFSQDYSHSTEEHGSRSMKNEQSRHSRDPHAVYTHRSREIEGNTGRCSENGREAHRHLHEERYRNDHRSGEKGDGVTIRSRKHRSDQRGSLEPRSSSDRHSGYSDADISKSTRRYNDYKRSRRQSSEDQNPEKHYSSVHRSRGKEHSTKRHSSHCTEDDYYEKKNDHSDEKNDGRGKSGKGKNHLDDSDDRWTATNSDVDSDFERYPRSNGKGSKLGSGRKDEIHSDAEAQYQRSAMEAKDHKSRKKRHRERRQYRDTEEDTSYSDTTDSSSESRSSEENVSKHRSRRKI
ncbi:hypothetical protein PR202_ga01701 [Eleusine coracana subsp. coracana]|uniref:Uncharacterized protein n=1 Tax=Eleusine coracana subsp. coracana TaxID=191504 RepID=A0AAV5BJH2_ELECO|nr:hypothetical protein PR202_ga01014 [Eleusine coracana subsp. coracana]GJM85894.1 hypothetical protein PR202_ga01701 [Eleusine coracana subsp. coracana]